MSDEFNFQDFINKIKQLKVKAANGNLWLSLTQMGNPPSSFEVLDE